MSSYYPGRDDQFRKGFSCPSRPVLIGSSDAIKRITEQAARLAQTDKPVLITGESGTGKEVVAKMIHCKSKRSTFPLVSINCAAFPDELLDAELFGHEKGAFSSAIAQRVGLVESASGGSFFLDEIAELRLTLQPKLLRLLQDKELRRLGSNK
ncbi:MAG: sigma-54 factor interaction domain-containing protein, partial [Pyrinomonadaceae bacterium]